MIDRFCSLVWNIFSWEEKHPVYKFFHRWNHTFDNWPCRILKSENHIGWVASLGVIWSKQTRANSYADQVVWGLGQLSSEYVQGWGFTTSLGSLWQCFTTIGVKIFPSSNATHIYSLQHLVEPLHRQSGFYAFSVWVFRHWIRFPWVFFRLQSFGSCTSPHMQDATAPSPFSWSLSGPAPECPWAA